MGFEPTNGGFADLSLGPLGYRAKQSSITNSQGSSEHRLSAAVTKQRQTTKARTYFFSRGEATLASRKNRAASSGGVGLM